MPSSDPADYAREAAELWGDTAAYAQSATRTSNYTTAHWEQLRAEAAQIDDGFLALMAQGLDADGVVAMDLAEQHRRHISRWFYDCSPEMHAGLGRLYVADRRFTVAIDKAGPGLAAYLAAAIEANYLRTA